MSNTNTDYALAKYLREQAKKQLPPVPKEVDEAMRHNASLPPSKEENSGEENEEIEKSERSGYQIAQRGLPIALQQQMLTARLKNEEISMDEFTTQFKKLVSKDEHSPESSQSNVVEGKKGGPKGASNFSSNKDFVLENLDACGLLPHQREALRSLVKHKENVSLIVCPTGSGKTGIAALAPYVLGSIKVLIITPSLEITRQIRECFNGVSKEKVATKTFYEKIGLIKKSEKKNFVVPATVIEKSTDFLKQKASFASHSLVIVNAQKFTTASNMKLEDFERDAFDLVIVDEAHHYPAPTWSQIYKYFIGRKLFLTATPYNRNSANIDKYIVSKESVCYECTEKDAIKAGIIRPLKYTAVKSKEIGLSPSEQFSVRANDVIAKVVKELEKHDAEDPRYIHKAMIITLKIEEAKECETYINKNFKSYGAMAYVQGVSRPLEDFTETDTVRILIVCKRLLEGFDHSRVSVTGILRNIQKASKVLFTQFIGRCVRKISPNDTVTASVIGHVSYPALQSLFDERNDLATEDPEDEDTDEVG